MIGVKNRTTMDMDSTIKGLPLTEENITKVVNSIINIEVNDGIQFEIKDVNYIR